MRDLNRVAGIIVGVYFAGVILYLLSANESLGVSVGDDMVLAGAFGWAVHVLLIARWSRRLDVIELALLAMGLHADVLVMATDVDAVYVGWGTPAARVVARAHPDALMERGEGFAAGSMRPKVEAACRFAAAGGMAAIGALVDVRQMVEGKAGTVVTLDADGIEFG